MLIVSLMDNSEWNFLDFSIIQILHEINFEDGGSLRITVFAILGVLTIVGLVNYSLKKVQKVIRIKIQSL